MEAPHLERKLVAILAADIEGFSTHMERDEGPAPSRFYLVIGSSSTHPLRRWRGVSRARKPPKLSEMTCPEATSSTCVRRRCVPSRQLNRSGPKTSKQLG